MSKAFVKDDGTDQPDDSPELEPSELIPKGIKNYITPQGAEKLRSELKELLNTKRPALVEVVAWAASNGDRSENADYIEGKRRLREFDRRIRFLTKRLEAAEIVDPAQQHNEKIHFGATVKILNEQGQEKSYRIVGVDEIDAKRGWISWISPIGKALLQHKVGESVTVQTPRGEEDLEIIQIDYESLS